MEIVFGMVNPPYRTGLVISQVPSERRVTTEPSGRVTLAVEKASLPAVPETDELALEEAEPAAEPVVVVFPPIVVDEVTLPPPAVTEDVVSPPAELVLSMIVQVVPSSSVTVSACAAQGTKRPKTSGTANALPMKVFDVMSMLPEMGPAA
jgi:hypothetical protein